MRTDYKELLQNTRVPFSELAGKTVLVTGATGLIGSYLVGFLAFLNDNYLTKPMHICALARNFETAKTKFADFFAKDNFSFIEQDITKQSLLYFSETFLVDYIFHSASYASPDKFKQDPLGIIDANTTGTRNMLALAKGNNAKMLFVSSGEVYGKTHAHALKESDYGFIDLADVRSCYAESKRCGELYCRCAQAQWGLDVKIARPFHSYGPGIDLNDTRVFSNFVKNILEGKNLQLFSDGSACRSFLYLQDLIAGFFTILFKGNSGEAYNVAGKYTSILGLAQTLVELFPEKNLKVEFAQQTNQDYMPSKISYNVGNTAKLEALGWRQRIFLQEGFRRTINSYAGSKK